MKSILFLTFLLSSFFCLSQEAATYEDVKENEYVLESEYRYRIAEKDTSYLTIQFTGEKFLKMIFPENDRPQYVFIDVAADFVAMQMNNGDPEIKSFSKQAPFNKNGTAVPVLEKVDTITYNGYECDVYHMQQGDELLAFYFEQKEGNTFNPIFANLLGIKGMDIDEASFPKGKFIAGMELEDGIPKDVVELVEVKENLKISFTLKTSE